VTHRVDHDVDADFVGGQAVLHRIDRVVDPFPGVAEVAVAGDERNKAAVFFLDAHVMWDDAALF